MTKRSGADAGSSVTPGGLTVSIVSHASGKLLKALLADLRRLDRRDLQIILTLNIPEDEGYLQAASDLPITTIRNAHPLGYGENHNRAFAAARGHCFFVLNPDIRFLATPFEALASTLSAPDIGVAAPLVLSPKGSIEDSFRRFPTLGRLASRALSRNCRPDYLLLDQPTLEVDWVAGMFMAFRSEVFARVGGFDTRYFMYLEDADICRRLQSAGLRAVLVPGVSVTHDAQRRSRGDLRHLSWHLRSALRFLLDH